MAPKQVNIAIIGGLLLRNNYVDQRLMYLQALEEWGQSSFLNWPGCLRTRLQLT